METSTRRDVAVVIVVFHLSDVNFLFKRLSIISCYFDVFIFDNGGNDHIDWSDFEHLTVVKNSQNIGTCNVLLELFKYISQDKYNSILFLDQDTELMSERIYDLRLITKYKWGYLKLRSYGIKELWIRIFNIPRFQFSGSFYNLKILRANLNNLSSEIFLDYCDWMIYWNLKVYIDEPIVLTGFINAHVFGERRNTFSVFTHSPSRVYYQVKNSLKLIKIPNVPLEVKLFLAIRLNAVFLSIPFLSHSRERYSQFFKGLIGESCKKNIIE